MLTKLYANGAAFLHTLKNDQRGVTAIEYAIVAVAIAALVAGVMKEGGALETALTDAFAKIADIVSQAVTDAGNNITPPSES